MELNRDSVGGPDGMAWAFYQLGKSLIHNMVRPSLKVRGCQDFPRIKT